MKDFKVNVLGYNAEQFKENYEQYITSIEDDMFDGKIFTMTAPQEVYNEISNLTEEGIYII